MINLLKVFRVRINLVKLLRNKIYFLLSSSSDGDAISLWFDEVHWLLKVQCYTCMLLRSSIWVLCYICKSFYVECVTVYTGFALITEQMFSQIKAEFLFVLTFIKFLICSVVIFDKAVGWYLLSF